MKPQNYRSMLELAFSVIPVGADKKPVIPEWKKYQSTFADEKEIQGWGYAFGIAAVCGSISEGLLCIDFDEKYDPERRVTRDYFAALKANGLEEVYKRCLIERTPSGGYHFAFRSRLEMASEKLARAEGQEGAMIETRGEGAYFVCDPTPGWKIIQGSFDTLPFIELDHALTFIDCARKLDRRKDPVPEKKFYPGPRKKRSGSPIDDFNARVAVEEMVDLLTRHGWRFARMSGPYMQFTRPDKNGRHVSASLAPNCAFTVFTTSTRFRAYSGSPSDKPESPAGVYTMLEHDGDFRASAKALREKGYGTKGPPCTP